MTLKAKQAFHYDVTIDRLLSEEEVAKQEARKARARGELPASRRGQVGERGGLGGRARRAQEMSPQQITWGRKRGGGGGKALARLSGQPTTCGRKGGRIWRRGWGVQRLLAREM
jgi:hypothetical protein